MFIEYTLIRVILKLLRILLDLIDKAVNDENGKQEAAKKE